MAKDILGDLARDMSKPLSNQKLSVVKSKSMMDYKSKMEKVEYGC